MNTITFEDAQLNGIVHKGDYFVTTAPKDVCLIVTKDSTGYPKDQAFQIKAGEQKLWRLEEGLKLWGEPTQRKLILQGQEGFIQGTDTIHSVARKLHILPGIFEQVQSCSLQHKDYITTYSQEVWQEEKKKYQHPDDKYLEYWLASRCILIDGIYVDRHIFYINNGEINSAALYYYSGNATLDVFAIRPEATLCAKLLLNIEDCDGTRNKPWRCLKK